jgi:hypothetical protein
MVDRRLVPLAQELKQPRRRLLVKFQLNKEATDLLYQVIAQRYERASTQ